MLPKHKEPSPDAQRLGSKADAVVPTTPEPGRQRHVNPQSQPTQARQGAPGSVTNSVSHSEANIDRGRHVVLTSGLYSYTCTYGCAHTHKPAYICNITHTLTHTYTHTVRRRERQSINLIAF